MSSIGRHGGEVPLRRDASAGEDVREQFDECGGRLAAGVRSELPVTEPGLNPPDGVRHSHVEAPSNATRWVIEGFPGPSTTVGRVVGRIAPNSSIIQYLLPRIGMLAIAVCAGKSCRRGDHTRDSVPTGVGPTPQNFTRDICAIKYICRISVVSGSQRPTDSVGQQHRNGVLGPSWVQS